jgi:flagellar hook-associated protein 1 FlgK
MSMGNALLNGLSGLLAAERAIATTSHNIANANTEGYSRQSVTNVSRPGEQRGAYFEGTGVRTASIQRVHDNLVESRLQTVSSEYHRIESLSQLTGRINTLFVEENTGLNAAQVDFFNALEDAANNPHAQATAEHVIATAETMASRMNFVEGQLKTLQADLTFSIKSDVAAINELSAGIYALNQQIAAGSTNQSGNPPSDLLDQRDSLLNELSSYVSIRPLPRNDMGIDVATTNGVPLVTIAGPATLSMANDSADPERMSFIINTGVGSRPVSEPTGGSLGGLLEFNRDVLDQTRSELGQLAAGLAFAVNDAYEEIDPATAGDPTTRTEFFDQSLSIPVGNAANQGTANATVSLLDPSVTTTSPYLMTYDGSGYTVTRLSDNIQVTGGANIVMDGISFTASGAAVAGDSFLIKPFAGVAETIKVKDVNPVDLATMVGATAQQYLPVSQSMADIRDSLIFNAGEVTLSEQYAAMVAGVGSATRSAEVQLKSMASILESTQSSHDQMSGVSLDEEAANLIKYQQAYEASARVMVASGTMFDTLIAAMNRA